MGFHIAITICNNILGTIFIIIVNIVDCDRYCNSISDDSVENEVTYPITTNHISNYEKVDFECVLAL